MQLLESHGDLMALFEEIMESGGLHIKIGSENRNTQFYEFSLVAMQFDSSHLSGIPVSSQRGTRRHHGVVALFGPTRMDYEWAISLISKLVWDLECPGH
jgi:transcriptional regulator of heat shock response